MSPIKLLTTYFLLCRKCANSCWKSILNSNHITDIKWISYQSSNHASLLAHLQTHVVIKRIETHTHTHAHSLNLRVALKTHVFRWKIGSLTLTSFFVLVQDMAQETKTSHIAQHAADLLVYYVTNTLYICVCVSLCIYMHSQADCK